VADQAHLTAGPSISVASCLHAIYLVYLTLFPEIVLARTERQGTFEEAQESSNARSASPSVPGYRIEIGQSITKTLDPREMKATCGTVKPVLACTALVGQRLSFDCLAEPLGWRIDAAAHALPMMFLTDIRHIPHEMLHLTDIREQLAQYLSTLAARHFATAETCKEAGEGEANSFVMRMRELRKDSNEKYRCSRPSNR